MEHFEYQGLLVTKDLEKERIHGLLDQSVRIFKRNGHAITKTRFVSSISAMSKWIQLRATAIMWWFIHLIQSWFSSVCWWAVNVIKVQHPKWGTKKNNCLKHFPCPMQELAQNEPSPSYYPVRRPHGQWPHGYSQAMKKKNSKKKN